MARFCRYCGTELADNAAFCEGCGKPAPKQDPPKMEAQQPKYCRSCGKPLVPGAKFCRSCGWKVEAAGQQSQQAPSQPAVQKSQSQSRPAAQQARRPGAQQYTQNAPQGGRPQQAASAPRSRSLKPVIAMVLAVAVFVCFVYPGFVRTKIFGSREGIHIASGGNTGSSGINDGNNGSGEDQKEIPDPKPLGNSKAVDIRPMDGIHIVIPENAMESDREVKLTEVSDEFFIEESERAAEEGIYVLDMLDIDLGLREDEYMPGQYRFEYDLSRLDLDEELYPYLKCFRVLEDGTREEYAVEIEGSVARFQSSQNTPMEWVIVLLVTQAVLNYRNNSAMMEGYSGKKICSDSAGPHGYVVWTRDDFYPLLENKWIDPYEIVEQKEIQYKNMAESAYPLEAYMLPGEGDKRLSQREAVERRNKDVATAVAGLIKSDTEYAQKLEEARRNYPYAVRKARSCFEDAWQYLAGSEQQARMPSKPVPVFFKYDTGATAVTKKTLHIYDAFMTLDIADIPKLDVKHGQTSNQQAEDGIFMTIVHELFHVCQFEYYTYIAFSSGDGEKGSFNTLLAEASAAVVEAEAYEHFRDRGMLPGYTGVSLKDAMDSGSGCVTPRDMCHFFAIPIDKNIGTAWGTEPGYQEADFLDYLNTKCGHRRMAEVWEKYSAYSSFSDPVKAAYNISEEVFANHQMDFLRERRRDKVMPEVADGLYTVKKGLAGIQNMDREHTYSYHYTQDGKNGFLNMHFLNKPDERPYAFLVIQNKDKGPYPETYELMIADTRKSKGLAEKSEMIDSENQMLFIGEKDMQSAAEIAVCELAKHSTNERTAAFDAYLIPHPDWPAEARLENHTVYLNVPGPNSDFYKDKNLYDRVDELGVYVTKNGHDSDDRGIYIDKDQMGKEMEIAESDYHLPSIDGLVTCAYFKVGDKYYYGPDTEIEDDIFGFYNINLTVKEYSSMLDNFAQAMPGQMSDYKDVYNTQSQMKVGVPQPATMVVESTGAVFESKPINTGNPMQDLIIQDLNLGQTSELKNGIRVTIMYNTTTADGKVDITKPQTNDMSMAYRYKGTLPVESWTYDNGLVKIPDEFKVTMEYDAADAINPEINLDYSGYFNGPLDLTFTRIKDGWKVKGESKFGYDGQQQNTFDYTLENGQIIQFNTGSIGLKFWYVLEGTKQDNRVWNMVPFDFGEGN